MKKKHKKYNTEEENSSQLRVTWKTNNPRYRIEIKKYIKRMT